jgi:hypothetical protein
MQGCTWKGRKTVMPIVRLMFNYLHGDIDKQVSPTNFGDAGSKFEAFAMCTEVALWLRAIALSHLMT